MWEQIFQVHQSEKQVIKSNLNYTELFTLMRLKKYQIPGKLT